VAELDGTVALVTGTAHGIGAAIADGLEADGATVHRVDRDSADLSDPDAVAALVERIGPVDVLVNNAGNAGPGAWPGLVSFCDTQPADWEPFLRVNLYGVLHCTRAWLPTMIEAGWGRVLTVISDAARGGEPKLAAYAAAKAGAAGFSRAVAREVGRYGVTVNCVSLGTMAAAEGDDHGRDLRGYAIRRPGRPGDVAGLVTFLAGEDAGWITGQTYPVDGGLSPAL
jgi:3-oxoacyl-[acyl-carrier protein] reductase